MSFESLESGPEVQELETEVETAQPIEEMSDRDLEAAIDTQEKGILNYLEKQAQSENPEVAAVASFQIEVLEDMNKLNAKLYKLIETEQFEKANQKAAEFLTEQRERLEAKGVQGSHIESILSEMEAFENIFGDMVEQRLVQDKPGFELMSTGLEFVPIVGGCKIFSEGVAGRTLTGKKLSLGQRAMKVAEGGAYMVLDAGAFAIGAASVGLGGAFVEGGKYALMGPKASKIMKRGAALIRVTKGIDTAGDISRGLFNAGRFMAKVEKGTDKIKLFREGRQAIKTATGLKESLKKRKATKETLAELVEQRHQLLDAIEAGLKKS